MKRKRENPHYNRGKIYRAPIRFVATEEQAKGWRGAAAKEGLTFSDWARQVLDAAARSLD